MTKHWSKVEYLCQTVKNPNIIVKGTKSYYSNAYTPDFENYVVRYLYGDEYSRNHFEAPFEYDKLYIGNYVSIGAETVILMGGNNTHRMDWFSNYPFLEKLQDLYQRRGDTVIGDGAWIGMRSFILPGIKIGEGAVVAACSVVTRDVEPYTVVGGNPARMLKRRFDEEIIRRLLALKIYDRPEEETQQLMPYLCDSNIERLEQAVGRLQK